MRRLALLLVLAAGLAWAQGPQTPVVAGVVTLGSACIPGSPFYANLSNGLMASCQSNGTTYVWTLVNVSAGSGFVVTPTFTGIAKATLGNPFLSLAQPSDFPPTNTSILGVNVKQAPYNACGNGVCDDTAAIAAACLAAKTAGGAGTYGAVVYFPPGRYRAAPTVCIGDPTQPAALGITFQGAGPLSSTLVSLSGGDVIDIANIVGIHSITIKDLGLDGANGSGNVGIRLTGSGTLYNFSLQNVFIQNVGAQCVYSPSIQVFTTFFDRIFCGSAVGNGIEIAGGNTTTISNSYASTVGANATAYVVYGGAMAFWNDNGINGTSGGNNNWAVIGRNTADGDPVVLGGVPTYVSGGGTIPPAGSSSCLLASANGGGSGGQLLMTSTNGTPIGFTVVSGGSGYASYPTSWTYVSGSGCSGSVTTSGGTLIGNLFGYANFYNCNLEGFSHWGVWLKTGSVANWYGSTFLAYNGTTTEAVHTETVAQGTMTMDAATEILTLGAWTNGYAIHNSGNGCNLMIDQTRNGTANTSGSCYSDAQSLVYPNATMRQTIATAGNYALTVPNFMATNGTWSNRFVSNGTTFAASGCGITGLTGGTTAGKFASGTTGTCTVVVTLPVASGGWACNAADITTSANVFRQTGAGGTSATLSGPTTSGDIIVFSCMGF